MSDTEKLAEEGALEARVAFWQVKGYTQEALEKHINDDPLDIYSITYNLALIKWLEEYTGFYLRFLSADRLDKYYEEVQKYPKILEKNPHIAKLIPEIKELHRFQR